MVKRRKIGLIYFYDENWIGGAYYIQNLVIAINNLDDSLKPEIIIYSELNQFNAFEAITKYPYLIHSSEYNRPSLLSRSINRLSLLFTKREIIKMEKYALDMLFPVYDVYEDISPPCLSLFWIPDFQEHYFPSFFSSAEIERRIEIQRRISSKINGTLLLSSQAAHNDYIKFYPNAVTINKIVPFAVSHPLFENIDIKILKEKYGITTKYFISSNQFWAHKNHKVILEAVKILKVKNIQIFIAFTGTQYDWRNPNYFEELKSFVDENNLTKNILFLGLIDRREQLQLMKNAEAVIQSSKFEGWSTVIEDAKSMNQIVIASNIPVHIEQLQNNGLLFNPDDPYDLSNIIEEINKARPEVIPIDYSINVKNYALNFLSIIQN